MISGGCGIKNCGLPFLFHRKFRQFPVKRNPPGDAHTAQRKAAALPCGVAQSPVRPLKIEGLGS